MNGKYFFWGSVFIGLGILTVLVVYGIYQLFSSIPYRSDLQLIATSLVIAVFVAWFIGYRVGRQESEGLKAGLELAMNARGLVPAPTSKKAQIKGIMAETIPWDVNNPPGNVLPSPDGFSQGQMPQPKIVMADRQMDVLDL